MTGNAPKRLTSAQADVARAFAKLEGMFPNQATHTFELRRCLHTTGNNPDEPFEAVVYVWQQRPHYPLKCDHLATGRASTPQGALRALLHQLGTLDQ